MRLTVCISALGAVCLGAVALLFIVLLLVLAALYYVIKALVTDPLIERLSRGTPVKVRRP